jgi:hypothetical protein
LGDDTSTHVYVPGSTKSNREKDLERAVRHEADSRAKKRMERELDDLRSSRNREDALALALAAQASQAKEDSLRQRALEAGSRFNIRFPAEYQKENRPHRNSLWERWRSTWTSRGLRAPASARAH